MRSLLVMAVLSIGVAAPAVASDGNYCPSEATIVGTAGPDKIVGTAGADIICGLGGNDVVYGREGNDDIYGGPGRDIVWGETGDDDLNGGTGNDSLAGGDGKDTIRGCYVGACGTAAAEDDDNIFGGPGADAMQGGPGNDVMYSGGSPGQDIMYGDAGDDALLGQGTTYGDTYSGGTGNDILYPPPVRTSPLGNRASGGSGNDVIILANFAMDAATLGAAPNVPVGNCKVGLPLSDDPQEGDKTSLKCTLPWPSKISALANVVSLNGTVDSNGEITAGASMIGGLASFKAVKWTALAKSQGAQPAWNADFCVCDPKLSPQLPYDLIL
ncbi:calcium-binding protein [Actinoplanes sp. NPDC049596]|uniref:calcium-binding protein n=1 Tax=unclassified Actinoplanes TaxID=2626549 RepID=UPI0034256309